MNFEALKMKFLTYLQEKITEEGDNSDIKTELYSDISIFMYQAEFEDFLQEEIGLDISEISANMEDLNSINFSDGQFQLEKDNKNNSISEETELYTNLLNELLSNENFVNAYDKNNDGGLSQNETYAFLDSLNNSNNSLEANDLFLASNNINSNAEKQRFTHTNKQTLSYSLNFLGTNASELDETSTHIISVLLDSDGDGSFSDSEKSNAKKLLSNLDSKTSALTREDVSVLSNYISSLKKLNMSDNEIIQRIKGLDGNINNFSVKDIKGIINSLKNGKDIAELQAMADAGIQPNSVIESSNSNSSSGSSSFNSSSSSSSSSSSANTTKTADNMSIKELETALQAAETKVTESETKYFEELEKADKDLSDKIKGLDTKIEDTQGKIDAANSRIGEIDGSISSLESQLSTAKKAQEESIETGTDIPEIDTSAIESQIKALEEEKNKLENETIPKLEEELKGYETELSGYETELTALNETHPALKSEFESFTAAISERDELKTALEKRKNTEAKAGESERPAANEGSKDYSGLEKYDLTNLPMTYTVDGKEYHCVGFEGYDLNNDGTIDFKPNSWEEVQRYFANAGIANIGKYGSMQCHNYSDQLGQFILGTVNKEFVQALYDETNDPNFGDQDKAGYMATHSEWNPRRFAKCKAKDRDAQHDILVNELQNGRPCLTIVDGGSHWVAAVGMSDDGDILIWDSYNGSMQRLGRSSNDTSGSRRDLVKCDGVMVYCDGYSYQYGTYKPIDYWEYIQEGPEYIRRNGVK